MDITPQQLERTFRTNIFAYFYLTRTFGVSVCLVVRSKSDRYSNYVHSIPQRQRCPT